MNCAMMDRDDYIWCDLSNRVNGAHAAAQENPAHTVEAVNNPVAAWRSAGALQHGRDG
jgi:hypothetical protein